MFLDEDKEKNNPGIVEDEGIEMVYVVAKIHKDGGITLEPVEKLE